MNGLADQLHLELLLQLALAVVLGGAVGLERELSGRPAGLRTTILICVGATLFTSLSVRMGSGHGDPGRVAAQILTGVGFIGAGTILHTRGHVTGLTSAATIWTVAAIGMALGAGAYVDAIGTTVLVLVVLNGLLYVERAVAKRAACTTIVIHAEPTAIGIDELEAFVRDTGLSITRSSVRRDGADLALELEMRGPKRLHDDVLLALSKHAGVRGVSTGE